MKTYECVDGTYIDIYISAAGGLVIKDNSCMQPRIAIPPEDREDFMTALKFVNDEDKK